MPALCITGIVTRYVNYKENDRILTVFTPDRGRIDVKARGCRKVKSPLAPVAQPFTFAEFELFSSNDKYVVNNATVNESFFPIREDIERYAVGSSMLQLCQDAVQENEPNERLFYLLYYSLSYLAYDEIPAEDLFLCFLARYLDLIGYRPTLTVCAHCGKDLHTENNIYYSVTAGGSVCAACSGGIPRVSKTALEAVRRMIVMDLQSINTVRLKDYLKKEISGILMSQTEYSLEFGSKALRFYSDFKRQTSSVSFLLD